MGRVKLNIVTKTDKGVLRDGEGGSATLVYGGEKNITNPRVRKMTRGSAIAETIGVVYFALTVYICGPNCKFFNLVLLFVQNSLLFVYEPM